MKFPLNCTIRIVDDLMFVAHPEIVHLTNRNDDFLGKTQRIEIYRGDTLLRVEEAWFWYRPTGKLFHVSSREVAA